MTALGAHEDDQAHEIFLSLDGNQFPGLCEAVDGCAVDGGDDGA